MKHYLAEQVYAYLSGECRFHITEVQKKNVERMVDGYFFEKELRQRAEAAVEVARKEGEENGFPLPPDRALTIVIEEAVKLYASHDFK